MLLMFWTSNCLRGWVCFSQRKNSRNAKKVYAEHCHLVFMIIVSRLFFSFAHYCCIKCDRYPLKRRGCWLFMKLATYYWLTCFLVLIGMHFLSFYLVGRYGLLQKQVHQKGFFFFCWTLIQEMNFDILS